MPEVVHAELHLEAILRELLLARQGGGVVHQDVQRAMLCLEGFHELADAGE